MDYYKRINKIDQEGIEMLEKHYEEMKTKNGVFIGNDEQGEFVVYPSKWDGEYVVTCISKEDFKSEGYNADDLTDEEMEQIAYDMEEMYVGYGDYWDTIQDYAKEKNLPKYNDEEDFEDD